MALEKIQKLGSVKASRWYEFSQELSLRGTGVTYRPTEMSSYTGEIHGTNGTRDVSLRVEHYDGAHCIFAAAEKELIRSKIYEINSRTTPALRNPGGDSWLDRPEKKPKKEKRAAAGNRHKHSLW